MRRSLAFVTEKDAALRRLLIRVLEGAAFDVLECTSDAQLQHQLRRSSLAVGQRTLLVMNADSAAPSLAQLGEATRLRLGGEPSEWCVILTFEFGAIEQLPTPSGCRMVALLEKPFDLDQFEQLAKACWSPVREPIS